MNPDPRAAALAAALTPQEWDLVVVGGGASGLGTAVEAASRGHRVLLLEAFDWAKGTSSRSTKLVHGGVRYLAQGQLGLVRAALRERGLLRRSAPHLVHDLPFVVPGDRPWALPWYGTGLWLYDRLAGRLGLGRSRLLGRKAARARVPTLRPQGLRGGVLYFDGGFDDARLAVALLRTLEGLGGAALNHAPVTGLLREAGRVCGVRFRDAETGTEHTARARVVVNAAGVWADAVRRLEDPAAARTLTPSQGVHLVVPRRFLPGDTALMVPRTDDGRVLFALPWHGRVVLGTTDTAVGDTPFEPRAQAAEIDFILRTAARYLDPAPGRSDVLSVFAGMRPLLRPEGSADTRAIRRDHAVFVSPGGLLTLAGGKWTTYRHMGEDAVNGAERLGGLPRRLSLTRGLRLHGATDTPPEGHWRVYGSDAARIRTLPGAGTRLHPALPYTEAEVRWAARHEGARTAEDVLARRLRAQILDARASLEMAPRVAELLAEELGKGAAWQAETVRAYEEVTAGYLLE